MSSSHIQEINFEFHHHQPVQLRFNDIDMLGHLNNSVYIQLLDLGKTAYFHQFIEGNLNHNNLSVVVANINCDFHAPAFLEEPLEVLTATTRLGERSLRLEQRVVNSATGDVKCHAITIMVCIDPATGRSADISDEWRKLITAYEGRNLD